MRACLETSETAVRILLVDDYRPWRGFLRSALEKSPQVQVVSEAGDGLEAVQNAEQLRPDLILLDIGLPGLNGIEAARRIRRLSPNSKIIFISENRSPEIATEALSAGGSGYVVKSDAGRELLPAIEAVIQNKQFLGASVAGSISNMASPERSKIDASLPSRNAGSESRHEVEFYRDDAAFVDGFARSIEASVKVGDAVVVIANESHRSGIRQRLQEAAVDVSAAIARGSYVSLDPADTLSGLMDGGMPDAVRCANAMGDLIRTAIKAASGERPRVAIFGECAPTLLAAGNVEAAVLLEHLWDKMMSGFHADTLCGYLWTAFPDKENSPIFQRICAEHGTVLAN